MEGLVYRYRTDDAFDGIDHGEGCFLPCSFWLVDNLVLQGKLRQGRTLFERLLKLQNDVGLLAEQYDVTNQRLDGNFPQALTHLALVNSAYLLQGATGNRRRRKE